MLGPQSATWPPCLKVSCEPLPQLDRRFRHPIGAIALVLPAVSAVCRTFGLGSEPTRYAVAGGSGAAFSVTVIPPDHFEWHPPHMRAVIAS